MLTLSPAGVKRREFLTQFYAEQWWKERRLPNERQFLFQHHIFRSKLKFETDVTEERIDSNRKFYREKCWQRQTGVVRSMKGILLKFETKLSSKLDYSQRWLAQYLSPSSTDNWSGVYIITPLNTFEWCKNKFFLCLTKQYKKFWKGNVTVNKNSLVLFFWASPHFVEGRNYEKYN